MLDRCNRPKCKDYPNYGERGIKVCPQWKDFTVFLTDMGECPAKHSLDRKDVNGDYEPNNCRWATLSTQNFNIRQRKNNTSGRTGVYKEKTRWSAEIGYKGKQIRLGSFDSFEKAVKAREEAEIKYFGVKRED